jgi:lactoylglutathione lyase
LQYAGGKAHGKCSIAGAVSPSTPGKPSRQGTRTQQISSENEKEHVMKLISVRLLVGDFPAALRFWRDTMRLPMTYSDETMGYAYFDTGNTGLELFSRDGFAAALSEATPAPVGRQTVIVFRVDDVDATYTDLVERGATPVTGPQDRPAWQARTAHLGDPDGHLIEIYSQLGGTGAPTA